MAELREAHTIFGPFPDHDPVDTALLFLRTNGYRIVSELRGPPPDELVVEALPSGAEDTEDTEDAEPVPETLATDADHRTESAAGEILVELHVERGKAGRGWFSSNLTELQTAVDIRLQGNKLLVEYVVDTTGQHLWENERTFWAREQKALEKFVLGDAALPNFVQSERSRASEVRREMVVMGLWIGGVVAVVMFVALVILLRD